MSIAALDELGAPQPGRCAICGHPASEDYEIVPARYGPGGAAGGVVLERAIRRPLCTAHIQSAKRGELERGARAEAGRKRKAELKRAQEAALLFDPGGRKPYQDADA